MEMSGCDIATVMWISLTYSSYPLVLPTDIPLEHLKIYFGRSYDILGLFLESHIVLFKLIRIPSQFRNIFGFAFLRNVSRRELSFS